MLEIFTAMAGGALILSLLEDTKDELTKAKKVAKYNPEDSIPDPFDY